jgi:thioredoxin reductase
MSSPTGSTSTSYEAIIIGGSYSGLHSALTLGRSLRKMLVMDGGDPCNRFSPHSHNVLTHEAAKPQEMAKQGKDQILDTYLLEIHPLF